MDMSTKNDGHPHVLVVDDDAVIRLLTASTLRKAGFKVLEACTADEGVMHVCDGNIDAVVTDVEMPGALNGYDLAWRAHIGCPNAALFIVSSSVGSDRRELPPRGRFLEKPVDPRILIAELRGALRLTKSKRTQIRRPLSQAVA